MAQILLEFMGHKLHSLYISLTVSGGGCCGPALGCLVEWGGEWVCIWLVLLLLKMLGLCGLVYIWV